MLIRVFTSIWFLFYLGSECVAQETEIHGHLPGYAGSEFIFETYDDYITHKSMILAKTIVGNEGHFSVKFKLDQSLTAFIKTGIYQGFMILEPGKSYDILLPEKKEKTKDEKLNPFFKEIRVFIQTRNNDSTELNTRRRHLSKHINQFLNRNMRTIAMSRMSRKKVESFIDSTRILFPAQENSTFYNHREYMIGHLRNLTYVRSIYKIADQHFSNKPVLYHNEDYMKLFNQVFDRFFVPFGQGEFGAGIHDTISKNKSLSGIQQRLQKCPSFGDQEFIDLLILKGLYDGFYFGDYQIEEVVCLLDSLAITTQSKENKRIAQNIKEKITRLAVGYTAPGFELVDKDSKRIRLEEFKGRYVYLNFCSYKNPACQEEFILLNELHKQYKDKLAIVSVSIDENPAEFFDYMKSNHYPWTCLNSAENPNILKDYEARVIPSYYLIDPYNKILLAPALSPRENFENDFHRILNNRK